MHIRKSMRAYPLYLAISAISALGMFTAWTTNSVYLIDTVHLNPFQLVLVGTVLEAVTFFLQVPTGALADMYNRRFSVSLGYALMGLSSLLIGLIPRFEAIIVAQVLLAAGFAFVIGAEEAWITSEVGEELAGKAFLHGSQWNLGATLVAIPLSAVLANFFEIQVPIFLGGAILLALGIFLLLAMPEDHFQPNREHTSSWRLLIQQAGTGWRAVRSSTMLLCIMGVAFFMGLASEGFDRLYPAHFLQDFTLPELWHLQPVTWIGMIMFGSTLLGLLATELIKRVVDTTSKKKIILVLGILQIILMTGMIAFALANDFYLAVLFYWCASVARTIRGPLLTTWITLASDPQKRATILSFEGMVDPMGQVAGGPLIGAIGQRFTLRLAICIAAVVMMPTLFFFGKAIKLNISEKQDVESKKEDSTVFADM
jgi:DHA3 family tetracycline resistance protein-like MFS transporter